MNEVAEKLIQAMRLWEEHPTKGAYAREKDGSRCPAQSVNAVCWCPVGAIQKVSGWGDSDYLVILLHEAAESLGIEHRGVLRPAANANDHTDMMPDVWSEAIEAAEALTA